jgi:ketosteroid isomerase-like protein
VDAGVLPAGEYDSSSGMEATHHRVPSADGRATTSSLRELIASFLNTLRRWYCTVRALMNSCSPISGVGVTVRRESCDVRFLRRQLVPRLAGASADGFAGRARSARAARPASPSSRGRRACVRRVSLQLVTLDRARTFIEAVTARDLDAVEELLDPAVETVTPRGTLQGVAAARQVLAKASGDEQFVVEQTEPEFDQIEGEVVARTHETARWRESGEVAYERDFAVRLTFRDERIVKIVVMPGGTPSR